MTWRFFAKYIVLGLLVIPIGIEMYTIIRYHSFYADLRGKGVGYYTIANQPFLFMLVAFPLVVVGMPLIYFTILMILADLGIVPRGWIYVKNSDTESD